MTREASSTTIVFVYGSLQQGHFNDWALSEAVCLGQTRTKVPHYDLISFGTFPAAIAGKHHIWGELYQIDAETLELLDQIEQVGKFYQRWAVFVDGVEQPVLMYGLNPDYPVPQQNSEGVHYHWASNTKSWRR